jgi:uncharacterized Fe-S cluster-containing radical SAM superfamily protein
MPVDTEGLAAKYRAQTIDLVNRRILVTDLRGTVQENDLSESPNCGGFGRIRHFRRATSEGWPTNPLPMEPANSRLGLAAADSINAQVFQNAACNWRCWYCFVPYELLSANPAHSSWLSASDLVSLYERESRRPPLIDLSGGQPELTPEWIPWVIEALGESALRDSVYVWSDDNLSCDYFWRYLTSAEQELVVNYPLYGRVACFKGFDQTSFAFNTRAEASWFDKQFELMARLVGSGMDVYAYATFTTPNADGIEDAMRRFVDRLQKIDENLPLRTVPLEIQHFSPVSSRLTTVHSLAFQNQWRAVEAWQREIGDRFSATARSVPIDQVALPYLAISRSS